MREFPRDPALDSTLFLLTEGYRFIGDRCRRLRSDVFRTRLMLSNVVCMTGADAAAVFYGGDRFTRRHSMPVMTLLSLQDRGSVQQLDGDAHQWRKQMFMSLMTRDSIGRLGDLADEEWRQAIARWKSMDRVVLLDEAHRIFCKAVCAWTGVPLPESQVDTRTREFAAMIDGAGSLGPRNWKGLSYRSRTEEWIRNVIDCAGRRRHKVTEGTPLAVILDYRERDGRPLDTQTAAVELINLLRPTVGIARYVMFAGLAMFRFPDALARLRDGGEEQALWFAQEVRRLAPFFPFAGGRVTEPFEWGGYGFDKHQWVLLDLFGTNRDAGIWEEPAAFRPERFRTWTGDPFRLIPQGGGSHFTGHRCAGEWITIELLKRAVQHLGALDFQVPDQDLRVHLSRMPAQPASGFVMGRVRPRGDFIPATSPAFDLHESTDVNPMPDRRQL